VASVRAKFLHPEGDQLTLLGVMQAYLAVERRRRAEWASDNFINIRWGVDGMGNWTTS
jgi:hypothetical protein